MPVMETETEQAKLVLELQRENRELRMQVAKLQQKQMILQAQSLAANASPTPTSATSSLLTPPTSARQNPKRKPRTTSIFSGTWFTPESKKKAAENELERTVKALEAEIERMKNEHSLQLKQKDDLIRELYQKADGKRIVTRSSLRPKETYTGEIKSPVHRFKSPAPPAKKRSFWDITTANSPSVTTLNGRKTRSHVVNEPIAPPSMLLQVN